MPTATGGRHAGASGPSVNDGDADCHRPRWTVGVGEWRLPHLLGRAHHHRRPTVLSFAERGTPGSGCCQDGRLCHPSGLPSPLSQPPAYVATYTATVPEDHTVAWSVEGTDAAKFAISADGALSFMAPPNFDSPGDADGDNTYLVTVKATANGNSDTRAVTVTVTDGNDAPYFTQTKEALFVEEGYAHWLFDFGATDPQGDTTTFSLTGEDSWAVSYEHIQILGTTCYAGLNLLHYIPPSLTTKIPRRRQGRCIQLHCASLRRGINYGAASNHHGDRCG